ncbi:histidine phosphatase superfamily domain-containing protein [Rhizoctonia solani AG-1 IA]|uniref:Histidine phosphatase superfamily domain-containing protein n=1 Tax=Thanatephorus cucumeris (strain AG1-IA) TaxID=983506 RepID=L8X1U9_THACA|nr:histidine phosphatase superfamily domain-containing protein [Rhizoctonia solani AG-1 IA]
MSAERRSSNRCQDMSVPGRCHQSLLFASGTAKFSPWNELDSVQPSPQIQFQDLDNNSQGIRYEAISGFFIQSDPSTDPQPHPPAFGLKSRTSATYWEDFEARIQKLQQSAPGNVRYVVCWLARHGQGWRKPLLVGDDQWQLLKHRLILPLDNVGVDRYGPIAWENKWSKQNGYLWDPLRRAQLSFLADAKLTPLGETQAKAVNEIWKKELSRPGDPIPVPTRLFSSPLTRALATLDLTFKGVLPKDESTGDPVRSPLVIENLREELSPYTSDHRSSKTDIQKAYPGFLFEDSFTEEVSTQENSDGGN